MISYTVKSHKNMISPSDAVAQYAETKYNKLDKLLLGASTEIKINFDKTNTDYQTTVTMIVDDLRDGLPQKVYKASHVDADVYKTIDEIELKLKHQLHKTLTVLNRDSRRPDKMVRQPKRPMTYDEIEDQIV